MRRLFFLDKLLVGVGAILESAGKTSTYQECVTAPLSREHDDDAASLEDEAEDEGEDVDEASGYGFDSVVSSIKKVCTTMTIQHRCKY
jgi:hypothetical protein